MASTQDLIERSLKLIGVLPEGETATNEMLTDALAALNDMLAEWQDHGIAINDGDLTLAETFPPDPAEGRAIRFCLAVELAPDYGAEIPVSVGARAEQLYTRLLNKYIEIVDMEIDRTLQSWYTGNGRYNVVTGKI